VDHRKICVRLSTGTQLPIGGDLLAGHGDLAVARHSALNERRTAKALFLISAVYVVLALWLLRVYGEDGIELAQVGYVLMLALALVFRKRLRI